MQSHHLLVELDCWACVLYMYIHSLSPHRQTQTLSLSLNMDEFKFTDLNVYDLYEICKLLCFSQLAAVGRVNKLFRAAAKRQMFQVVKHTTAIRIQCIDRKWNPLYGTPYYRRHECPNPSHKNPLCINLCANMATAESYFSAIRAIFSHLSLAYNAKDLPFQFVELDSGPCSHWRNTNWEETITVPDPLVGFDISVLPSLEHLVANEQDIISPRFVPTCLDFSSKWWLKYSRDVGTSNNLESILLQLKACLTRNQRRRRVAPYMYLTVPWPCPASEQYTFDMVYRHIQSSVSHLCLSEAGFLLRNLGHAPNVSLKSVTISPRYNAVEHGPLVKIIDSYPGLVQMSFSCTLVVLLAMPTKAFHKLTGMEWTEAAPLRDIIEPEEGGQPKNNPYHYWDILSLSDSIRITELWTPTVLKALGLHFGFLPTITGEMGTNILQRYPRLEILNISTGEPAEYGKPLTPWSATTISHSLTDNCCLKVILLSMHHFEGEECRQKIEQFLASIKYFSHAAILWGSTSIATLHHHRPPRDSVWDGKIPESYMELSNGMHALAVWS
jgi:hypothetical protein